LLSGFNIALVSHLGAADHELKVALELTILADSRLNHRPCYLLNEEIVEHKDNAVSYYSFYVTGVSHIIIMQESTEEAEASISPLNVSDDPDLNRTFTARRKAAKRTRPWDLGTGEELTLVSPPPPQDEDIPATKKRRLEEPISASTDETEAARKFSSLDTAVSLFMLLSTQMRFPGKLPRRHVTGHQKKIRS
jgi:hypothetical protein